MMNVVFNEPVEYVANLDDSYSLTRDFKPRVDHLSVPDAERLINEIKPKVAILTHFGMGMWRAQPWKIAEQLTEKTGVKVIAARDGMTFDLKQLQ